MQINQARSKVPAIPGAVAASQFSDEMLVELIADGDKCALRILYLRHRERVLRFLMRLVKNESMAEEIVNEVFLAIWRHADQFDAKSQTATWMPGIAHNRAVSEIRRHATRATSGVSLAAVDSPVSRRPRKPGSGSTKSPAEAGPCDPWPASM